MTSPDICFVTTCRGRRAHLEQALPRMVAQPGTACVVVDYGCPDGTGDWVAATYPQVTVVRVGDRPRFELSRARNLGAAATQAPWLCFVDADALLAANFAEVVRPLLAPGSYYRAEPRVRDGSGMCIVHRDDFAAIDGYDDVIQGWGMEDKDFYFRARLAGLSMKPFPSELVTMIAHGGAERTGHYDVKRTHLNSTANLVYCRAKWDLMRLSGRKLDATARATLYGNLHGAALDAQKRGTSVQLRVPVETVESLSGSPLKVSLVYELGKPRDKASPPPHALH